MIILSSTYYPVCCRSLRNLFLSFSLALVTFFSATSFGFDKFDYNLRLIPELMQNRMQDYAKLHVKRLKEKHPKRVNAIRLALARGYFRSGNSVEANRVLEKIPNDSKYYTQSRLLMAEKALRNNKTKEAEKAYKAFFKKRQEPVSRKKMAVKSFKDAVKFYAHVFVKQGNPDRAVKVLDYLKNIKGKHAFDKLRLTLLKGRYALNAAQKEQEKTDSFDKKTVQQYVKKLQEMQWEAGNSPITTLAFLDAAKGHVMLGNYDQAIDNLEGVVSDVRDLVKKGALQENPLPKLLFTYGKALRLKGKEQLDAGNKENAKEHLIKSLKIFVKLKKNAPDTDYYSKATMQSDMAKQHLGELGIDSVNVKDRESFLKSIKKGDRFFDAGNYEKAIAPYRNALGVSRLSDQIPEVGMKLSYSYGQQGRYLLAESVASYLGDVFPDAKQTGTALLQSGAFVFEHAQEVEDKEKKDFFRKEAMTIWDQFVDTCPDHNKAPDIGFLIAEYHYSKGVNLAERAEKLDNLQKKEDVKQQAREMFKKCIPHYERMIEDFGGTPKGIRSYYKLGWVYTNIDKPKKAAENFKIYSRLETNPENQQDRLWAKFYAGEELMYTNAPEKAIKPFKQLLGWLDPQGDSGFDPDTDLAANLREDTLSYLGWTYDLSAERIRPRIQDLSSRLDALNEKIATANENIARAEKAMDRAEKLPSKAKEKFQNKKEKITKPLPKPEQAALDEKMPSEDELQGMSEEEKKLAKSKARDEAERQAEKFKEQYIQQYEGRSGSLEERQQAFDGERVSYENNIEKLKADIEELSNREEKLASDLESCKSKIDKQWQEAKEQIKENYKLWSERFNRMRELYKKAKKNKNKKRMKRAQKKGRIAKNKRDEIKKVAAKIKDENVEAVSDKDAKEELRGLVSKRKKIKDNLHAVRTELAVNERRKALKETNLEIVLTRLDLLNVQQQVNEIKADVLALDREEREAALEEKEFDSLKEKGISFAEKVLKLQKDKAELLKEQAQEDLKASRGLKEELNERKEELEKEKQKLREQFLAKKETAKNHLADFLEKYPDSEHAPQNMARIGSIYVELEKYDKAAEYLSELAEQHPDSEALAGAMYDLGRARMEQGNVEKAVKAFEETLTEVESQSMGNLSYILEQLMDTEHAKLAYKAGSQLLERAQDSNHEDYAQLKEYREKLFYRVATAAVNAGEFTKAVGVIKNLKALNEKTAYLWKAKLRKAEAYRSMDPPEYGKASKALNEVARNAQSVFLQNQAILKAGLMRLKRDSREQVKKALSSFHQLVMQSGDGGVTYLGEADEGTLSSEEEKENQKLLEKAVYYCAKSNALLGKEEEKEIMVQEYRERYSGGEFAGEINNLPSAKFAEASGNQETED